LSQLSYCPETFVTYPKGPRSFRIGKRGRTISGAERKSMAVAGHERLRQEAPPVDAHEQEELEGEAYLRRAEHLHPKREKHVRNDEIDDQKRKKEEETDREGLRQLRHHERGNEHRKIRRANFRTLRFGPRALSDREEARLLFGACIRREEFAK